MAPLDKPWGLRWRCSYWYTTFVVGLGLLVDLMVYTIIVPVIPFRLQDLGYKGVSGLTGWMLFAYSASLVISTLPIAVVSEKYSNRQYILMLGQLILIGAQIMLMEVRQYWLMIIARILQGASSSVIWVLGLALVCDTTPEAIIGRQLGIAVSGFSLGAFIGPPVGGALYARFGIRGPFIFSTLVTVVDLIARTLIIERKNALLYGVDPAALPSSEEKASGPTDLEGDKKAEKLSGQIADIASKPSDNTEDCIQASEHTVVSLSLLEVLKVLTKSVRAVTVVYNTLVYGIAYCSQEPALPLYLQSRWGLNSSKVGLVYLAGVVPTLVSAPVAGWLSDTKGPEWISTISFIVGIPWWGLIAIRGSLAEFIVFYAILNFFTAAILSPLSAELASIARSHEGVGYAHVYGAFNMAFGVGAALGPIIGGQLYQHLRKGWLAISMIAVGLLTVSSVLAFCFTGSIPLSRRLLRQEKSTSPPAQSDAD
ncbi:MFS general substrate transporter [Trametopsis cervina]|nr:MFS general substrate transporter [Trametopsis cervina]